MGTVSTSGGSACHASLHPSGRFIAVSNHGLPPKPPPELEGSVSGSVAIIALTPNGDVERQSCWLPTPTETDSALLSDPARTDWTTHAHSANWDRSGTWLFVCEKGTDRVITYAFDDSSGQLTPHAETMVPVGHAARHLAVPFHARPFFFTPGLFTCPASTNCFLKARYSHSSEVSAFTRRFHGPSGTLQQPLYLRRRGGGERSRGLRLQWEHGHAHAEAVSEHAAAARSGHHTGARTPLLCIVDLLAILAPTAGIRPAPQDCRSLHRERYSSTCGP